MSKLPSVSLEKFTTLRFHPEATLCPEDVPDLKPHVSISKTLPLQDLPQSEVSDSESEAPNSSPPRSPPTVMPLHPPPH